MKILFDFGLVVLVWLVQLIIYPSFRYMPRDQLLIWHTKYTSRITLVVLPLMLGQVIFHSILLIKSPEIIGFVQGVLILVLWGLTFLKAVPLHNRIQQGNNLNQTIPQLILWNWPRTILWTIIFVLTFIQK